jgi:hypothetical protein
MSNARFATARALFETFPATITKLAVAPTDDPPHIFLQTLLAKEKLEEAVTFCAHLLPRREAVWWACTCVRARPSTNSQNQAACLQAAEAWVHEPDDAHRQRALAVGTEGDSNQAMTWLALGAGWAGGFLVNIPQKQVPVPQYMTPRASRIAIMLNIAGLKAPERATRLKSCIAEGMKLVETGL